MSLADHRPRQDGPTRGRPRSEAVERSITEGVLKLLEDGVPLAELSIERIARTAGVVALLEQTRQRGLMTRSSVLLHNVIAQMKSSPKIWDAYHANVIEPRRRKQYAILRRGQETGELRTDIDIDVMNDMVFGPMLVRAVMRPDADLPEGLAEQIADVALTGLRPVSAPNT